MHSVEAIYSGGVFRPLTEVNMAENQRVRLTIDSSPEPPANKPIRTAQDLIESGLAGMWSDRDDIQDSHDFASRIRKEAENDFVHAAQLVLNKNRELYRRLS